MCNVQQVDNQTLKKKNKDVHHADIFGDIDVQIMFLNIVTINRSHFYADREEHCFSQF